MKKQLLILMIILITAAGYGQDKQYWTRTGPENTTGAALLDRRSVPVDFQSFALDLEGLKTLLSGAPQREMINILPGVPVAFPDAEGNLKSFRVYEASILHPELARQHPDVRSYAGISVDDPATTIRISLTVFGFHGIIFSPEAGTTYIDPYTKDLSNYIIYSKSKLTADPGFECGFAEESGEETGTSNRNGNETQSNTGIFRVYRLALSSTIEYSTFHVNQAGQGGASEPVKKATVLAAMTVTMTRVNGVYERDLSLTMQIIPNNTLLINIDSDNFTNNSGGAMLGQNQTFVDNTVGNGSYDIGHVFSTGGGGVASQGVCNSSVKARGVTGSGAPVGDAFDIDYVAHEIGHQFGAAHTFSSTSGGCSGNISTTSAMEPGSGTTIMAYANLCSPHNVQTSSDAYFHSRSIQQIDAYISGAGNCAAASANPNQAPVIIPLPNYTIPKSTSFVLRGNATDPDGDQLTYCWEQNDPGAPVQPPSPASTVGPNFRSRPPTLSPNRYFPPLGSTSNTWEVIPSVPRTMNFALTVRDNNVVNGGQTNRDDVVVTVANVGPFVVTAPNTAVTWAAGSTQTVTWDVAGTTGNGINSKYVDVFLSTNGGNSYPVMLASKVPNDGSEQVTIPNTPGLANRIMVMSYDNIFYDTSNANFAISAPTPGFAIAFNGIAGEQNRGGCLGSNTVYTFNYSTFGGFTGSTTFSASGNPSGTTVTFTPNPATSPGTITMTISNTAGAAEGFYPIIVTATSGATTKTLNLYLELTTAMFNTITLLSPANNATGVLNDVTLSWQPDLFNATSYDVEIATDVNFVNIIGSVNTTGSSYTISDLANLTNYFWRVLPNNNFCSGNYSATFTFKTAHCGGYPSTNVPLTISASGTPTINSTLTITNAQSQQISDITVNLNITHSFIRDLTATLIAPNGTQVVLFSTICPNEPGHEDAIASFNNGGTAITCNSGNPAISGRLAPAQSLAPFIGMSSEGTWTLRVSDSSNQDGGALNSWSLDICGLQAPLTVAEQTDLSFTVYPNPSSESFTVKSDKLVSESAQIQVYDIRGRMIYDKQHAANGMLDTTVRLDNASAGVYLLSVSDGQNREVRRIIIE